jgi:hypothetical protein
MNGHDLEGMLGVIRCERCGHRIEGEIECPFCFPFGEAVTRDALPKWIYFTACFLTSPFSIYFVVRSSRLGPAEKIVAVLGCCLWFGVYVVTL